MRDPKLRDKFCNAVADKLLEYIIRERLAIDVARAIYDDAVRKYKKDRNGERLRRFLVWNEQFLIAYRRNIKRRFTEMEKEALGNIKNLYKYYNERTYELKDHDSGNYNQALQRIREWDYNSDSQIALGVFYKKEIPTFEDKFKEFKLEKEDKKLKIEKLLGKKI